MKFAQLIAVGSLAGMSAAAKLSHPLYRRTAASGTDELHQASSSVQAENKMVLVADVIAGAEKVDAKVLAATSNATGNSSEMATGIISSDNNDVSYYLDLQLGSDRQNFSVVVDTGSYYTWVYSSSCNDSTCESHQRYTPDNSTTCVDTALQFSIEYSTASISGAVYNDEVSFSGFRTRIAFGGAANSASAFANFDIDGIMGLAATDTSDSFPGILTTLKNQSLIDERVFGVNLGRAKNPDDEGSITFGGYDEDKFDGDIVWTSVIEDSVLWTIPVDSTRLSGTELTFNSTRNAVVDTGTTLIVMPPDDALSLHSYISGAQTDGSNYAVPCSTNMTLQLGFGGAVWTIDTSDMVGSPVSDGSDMCASNVQGIDFAGGSTWLVGDVFLKNVYSVFDMDQRRVGFANKKATSTEATPKDSLQLSSGLYESLALLAASTASVGTVETSASSSVVPTGTVTATAAGIGLSGASDSSTTSTSNSSSAGSSNAAATATASDAHSGALPLRPALAWLPIAALIAASL